MPKRRFAKRVRRIYVVSCAGTNSHYKPDKLCYVCGLAKADTTSYPGIVEFLKGVMSLILQEGKVTYQRIFNWISKKAQKCGGCFAFVVKKIRVYLNRLCALNCITKLNENMFAL